MDFQNPQLLYQPGGLGSAAASAAQQQQQQHLHIVNEAAAANSKKKSRRAADSASQKRRCVSTACIACRRRKSKCDGALPSCAACASVYGTECVYDPNSDHRRKGVYREKLDSVKARSSTLQILIEAILNAPEDEVPEIVRKIRTCDSLDAVAEQILKQEYGPNDDGDDGDGDGRGTGPGMDGMMMDDGGFFGEDGGADSEAARLQPIEGERELARKMGELRLENGSVRFIGGTSHLIYLGDPNDTGEQVEKAEPGYGQVAVQDPITSWSDASKDTELVVHLMNMYFNWHYPYFTTLSKSLFYRDFFAGKPRGSPKGTVYCSSLLVNAMLALGCHFTSHPLAYQAGGDSRTKGDHFFAECKRLIVENDEYEKPRLTTVQALCLMSVREAGCGREAKGWVYSGMAFRMAQDMGLNLDAGGLAANGERMSDQEVDARRITFWGCFLFDKCWSNYLGRLPQLPRSSYSVPKYDVFPDEDSELWSPFTDAGFDQSSKQPSRTRAIGLQLSKLCEISSDLLLFFYHPNHIGRSSGKAVELRKLSELHRALETWHQELPKEFEPKEGQLPNVILMHMFWHLQYIHLFRPFLKYTPANSPLPASVSPRKMCTTNAGAISKLMRLYKKAYNLRQICNIAVYMVHSACTIHLLNLPEKTARRDIIHGVRHLEEIAEDWLCARRTLSIISVLARKWNVELPDEARQVLDHTDEKYGTFATSDVPSPPRSTPGLVAGAAGGPHYQAASANSHHYHHSHSASPALAMAYTVQAPSSQAASASTPPGSGGSSSGAGASPAAAVVAYNKAEPAAAGFSSLPLTPSYTNATPPPPHHHQHLRAESSPLVGGAAAPAAAGPVDFLASLAAAAAAGQQAQANAGSPAAAAALRAAPSPQGQAWGPSAMASTVGAAAAGGGGGGAGGGGASPAPSASSVGIFAALDGQDWFLKDSVNWQQHFESWNKDPASWGSLAASVSSPAASSSGGGGGAMQQNAAAAATVPRTTGALDAALDPAALYMFRGMSSPNAAQGGTPEYDATLDALASLDGINMDGWGALSHLE